MPQVLSPALIAASLTELWSPRVMAEVDDAYIKVAKVQGTLAWRPDHPASGNPQMFCFT